MLLVKKHISLSVFIIMVLCLGCTSTARNNQAGTKQLLGTSDDETVYDAAEALTAVTGAMSNKDLSEEELYQAAKEMRNDPEAQSAVDSISTAFDKENVHVKYSPVTGKRYSADLEFDPETGVKLLPVE